MTIPAWTADPLVWGVGPRVLEVFVEPTCPFSAKALSKLDTLLERAGEDRLSVKIRLHSQPWHMFSGVIIRCVLAASTLKEGKAAAKKVLQLVAANREEFEFEHHCQGPNLNTTPREIIERLCTYSGLDLVGPFMYPDLEREVKWHARYARQNGIHVSPTFMVDGLVQPNINSGQSPSEWLSQLFERYPSAEGRLP